MREATEAVRLAADLVRVTLPHLVGLLGKVRIEMDPRIETAAVFASGRLLINAKWFGWLEPGGRAYVLAHELLHLALRTHDRAGGAEARRANVAHDYIINDILSQAFGCEPPGDGLHMPGASKHSLEELMLRIDPDRSCWAGGANAMQSALAEAGLTSSTPQAQDVLDDEVERRLFPGLSLREQKRQRNEIERLAAQACAESVARESASRAVRGLHAGREGTGGTEPGHGAHWLKALGSGYSPPWEAALQRWLEAIAPGDRSFARPSRRSGTRRDVVLPGRKREGFALHIVLDTSGSMTDELAHCLGMIGTFAEASGVADAHILQCDMRVTVDEWVEVTQLSRYAIRGYGGSDMSPAMRQLAQDPEVEAAIVLTDGYIGYPPDAMPYEVLWTIVGAGRFRAPYGQVVQVRRG